VRVISIQLEAVKLANNCTNDKMQKHKKTLFTLIEEKGGICMGGFRHSGQALAGTTGWVFAHNAFITIFRAMNTYAVIILVGIVLTTALDVIADVLNLRALKPEVPEDFQDVYAEDEYARSQHYTHVKTQFGFISSGFDLALFLAFWFFGGFPWLFEVVQQFDLNPVLSGIAFIGILSIAKGMLGLPFSIYSTFVIEERFGFNKTTVKTFILDLLKGGLLGLLLGVPILAGILAFFEYAGPLAWLYGWIAVTVVTLIIQYIAPTWIMPLFNKFTALEEGTLHTAIVEYAKSVSFPLTGVFVIDGSKRSTKANAFFTGFGKNKRIALYDTLIEKHSEDELVSVLAHEIGHYKKKHILIGTAIGIIHTGLLFFLLSLFIGSTELAAAFYMPVATVYGGLIFFGMLYEPISTVLGILMNMLSRKHEYEADAFAATTRNNTQWMIDALKKLSVTNLSNVSPHPFYVFLNYSHPTVLERIKAMRRNADVR
jgi:STE24 endopeptidase